MNWDDDSIGYLIRQVAAWPRAYLEAILGVGHPEEVQAWAAGVTEPSPAQRSVLTLMKAFGPRAVLEALGLEVPESDAVEASFVVSAKKSKAPSQAALDLRARVAEAQAELERRCKDEAGAEAHPQVLGEEGGYTLEFLPIEANNPEARVFILGLTPGRYQAEIYMDRYLDARRAGCSHTEAAWKAKTAASFAGAMRRNLVTMLDELGLPQRLGLESTADLFEGYRRLLRTSSAIRYPAYRRGRGKNYGGSPTPDKIPLFWTCVEACLQPLIAAKSIDPSRVLLGFPHPSGANGHRLRQFGERYDMLVDSFANRSRLSDEGLLCAVFRSDTSKEVSATDV